MNYALITGASKGIGKAIAEELAAKNIDVLLVARHKDLLQETAKYLHTQYGVNAHYLAIDLSNETAPQQVFNWINENKFQVSILINNAGYGLSGGIEKYSLKEHQQMMEVNMNTPVALTYLLLPMLKQQHKAFILNVSSGAAYQSIPGLNIYAATKSFLLSFSRGLNYELKGTNISVSAICPGATDTEFANRANVNSPKAVKLAKQFNMTPKAVATIALNGMFAGELEIVPGFVNKLAVFMAWLLPKKLLEKSAAGIYDL